MSIDFIVALSAAGAGYLIGSLPFGYLVAKANGVDIFSVGSKNPGATNVKRCVGKKAGNIVFLLDAIKGFAATAWPILLAGETFHYGLVGLVFAVLGHSFSLFTKFRGGKGVATMLGGVVALMLVAAVVGVLVWLVVFYTSRYVSLASICLAVSLPITNLIIGAPAVLTWVSLALGLLVVVRHKDNIVRLIRGEENKFAKK
ncbi:glycerol-3-phosphate 1-O-acyltransferase PlsY [Pelagicoccus sp. NFK12]|uniref:Glycerol-3-phosphate acyltransferase n=1 Tax=Pelagicoccus enzymogenes TaxID=2773457 RepID=A0A927IFJ7_9BACT|nr:glycerol-3-phosphate 1-O-acyltransferase PlsY [Pelagicoccus enzymogenes]MBD5780177.1 glycerol-3-phosphate 1-O-acyltransferase PlsY [Pelagicoccus enzymogenes]MDQ8198560.1 glycerol-3-phosphate 1-O-acyltransferase PlsY [Pelagicoccus enzymogenes]